VAQGDEARPEREQKEKITVRFCMVGNEMEQLIDQLRGMTPFAKLEFARVH
jgi:hypothetical protein